MRSLHPDRLPLGVLVADRDDVVLEANAAFVAWCGSDPVGRPVSDFLVPVEDFLEGTGEFAQMMAHPEDAQRAALVSRTPSEGGFILTALEASDRYAAGIRLRDSHALADRTRRRLELIIDAAISFAGATSESALAATLASTVASAYRADESVVFLLDDQSAFRQVAGTNPFEAFPEIALLTGQAMQLRQVLTVSGVEEANRISPVLGSIFEGSGVYAVLVAPIRHDTDLLGLFGCFFRHARQFDAEAAPLAEALAGQAGQAATALRLQHRLAHAAMHDETTGLPNRRLLEQKVAELARPAGLAVLFLDLDGFKAVNDELGHHVGDDVLREVARRLQEAVREGDIVARYGGDEFVVACPADSPEVAYEVAERLRAAVAQPYPGVPSHLDLHASVGVAMTTHWSLSIDQLIRRADQAMYLAKTDGGDRVMRA